VFSLLVAKNRVGKVISGFQKHVCDAQLRGVRRGTHTCRARPHHCDLKTLCHVALRTFGLRV